MSYFNIQRNFFLVPPTKVLGEYEKIDKFMELLEKSGISKIIKSVKQKNQLCKQQENPKYNPYNLFAAIIYCFAKFKSSLRNIEDKCLFDIRVIYIMEGKIPDHSTFGNFINDYFLPYQYEIFTLINKQIIKELNLDTSDNYVDGTKLEANANKYKFVWKPTKYHKKLNETIKDYLVGLEHINVNTKKDFIKSYELKEIINKYGKEKNIDINNIPSGRGQRLTTEQRNYKIGHKYLLKLLDYEEKEEICGEKRNSYFKTDHDATAMVLKEDYYSKLSHDFHAGYNFQAILSSGLIMMYGVFQDRADYYTLVPLLNLYNQYYRVYPKNLCADSGYGIYTNYLFLEENKIGNYIKFQNWKGESNGKRPQLFYTFNDGVLCLNSNIGEEVKFTNRHQKNKKTKLYKFTGCNNCNYAYICKAKLKQENKEKNDRIVELNLEYELFKENARNNLLSPKGIEMRINRSIQSEGSFAQIKNNMDYDRIRRRGLEKVSCEIMLECLGANIKRYLNSLDDEIKFKNTFWKKPITLHSEKFPSVKQKKTIEKN